MNDKALKRKKRKLAPTEYRERGVFEGLYLDQLSH